MRHPNEVASLLAKALARRHRSTRPDTRSTRAAAAASALASHCVVSLQVRLLVCLGVND